MSSIVEVCFNLFTCMDVSICVQGYKVKFITNYGLSSNSLKAKVLDFVLIVGISRSILRTAYRICGLSLSHTIASVLM